jgi:V/A-type H+-transporting ATPase subunit A
MIREDFLQQNAFVDVDSYSSYDRQLKLLGLILDYDRLCREALSQGADMNALFEIPAREQIGRAKTVPAEEYAEVYARISDNMKLQIDEIAAGGDEL